MRIDKDNYYLDIAEAVAARSTCIRRLYGAVIVKNDEIIATGYNGAPRGEKNCCDLDYCYRKQNNIPAGTQYEKCRSVHGEQNAIISACRNNMIDSTMYITGIDYDSGTYANAKPCDICRRMIQNAGITKVIMRINANDYASMVYDHNNGNWHAE